MVGKPLPPNPTRPLESAAPLRQEPRTASASVAAGRILDSSGTTDGAGRKRGDRASGKTPVRLVSLDAFRGFIMMMLAAEGFGIYAFSRIPESSPVWQSHDYGFWQAVGFHFEHPEWRSAFEYFKVSFWDLIQPSFMFMVGVSMPFSYARREKRGQGWAARAGHALIRSVVLILLGVFLYSMHHERTNWIFPNVLCQIGLGYFFAWLLLNRHRGVQFAALAVILIGYWGWFRMNPPPEKYDYAAVGVNDTADVEPDQKEVFKGSFAAWSKNANAAFLFDQWLLPKLRSVPPEPIAAADHRRRGDWQFVSRQETDALDDKAGSVTPAAEPASDVASEPPATAENPGAAGESVAAGSETPAGDGSAPQTPEPVEANKPGWFRQWFLSNPEPYKFDDGGYTTLNFIPSIATTLMGILCGQLLISPDNSKWKRLGLLILGAVICLGLGILADQTVCPVVKRIWTPGWVLFSGGYVIGLLALFYLLFDIAPLRLLALPLVVVGMNSILIYLLGETLGHWMRESVVRVHFSGMIGHVFGPKALDPQWYESITLSSGAFVLFWLLLLWLYRQRIFLRI